MKQTPFDTLQALLVLSFAFCEANGLKTSHGLCTARQPKLTVLHHQLSMAMARACASEIVSCGIQVAAWSNEVDISTLVNRTLGTAVPVVARVTVSTIVAVEI